MPEIKVAGVKNGRMTMTETITAIIAIFVSIKSFLICTFSSVKCHYLIKDEHESKDEMELAQNSKRIKDRHEV